MIDTRPDAIVNSARKCLCPSSESTWDEVSGSEIRVSGFVMRFIRWAKRRVYHFSDRSCVSGRASMLGFWVSGLGGSVHTTLLIASLVDFGLRVSGFGFWVQGSGFVCWGDQGLEV